MNPLKKLIEQGQTISMDYMRRGILENGELEKLVAEDGLGGLTSNPKIFQTAMTESDEYDAQIESILAERPTVDTATLYEALALTDIRAAADVLRPVYDRTDRRDGFVSLEVSPHLAGDTDGTIEEGRRLWKQVDRPNVFIKVPGTPAGVPAIEELLVDGVNVNVTLMFSLAHYEAVSGAYLRALDRSEHPERLTSVASIFVSRVTAAVDQRLEEVGSGAARGLEGRIGIANAKKIYQKFLEVVGGAAFEEQRRRGARPQRLLWASTGTKSAAYRDVMYVEELIGPDTVITMPPETLKAFRDHGEVRGATVLDGVERAQAELETLARLGIDLGEVTEELQTEGVRKFVEPFDELLAALDEKRRRLQAA